MIPFSVRVPASTANVGPGFDSVGIALSLYLGVVVKEKADKWQVIHSFEESIPTDDKNLIVSTACKVCPSISPHIIEVTSNIPLTRGLGSSASAIVAGIELANQLGNLNLTADQKVQIATNFEGHPDNVAASILGGTVIGVLDGKDVSVVRIESKELGVISLIPNAELNTDESRSVLPKMFPFHEAVKASAISNVLVAALCQKRWEVVGEMMERDHFHEPYRLELVPLLPSIRKCAKEFGAYGTALSGAGPSIFILTPYEKRQEIAEQLARVFTDMKVCELEIDHKGIIVNKEEHIGS
ncbi:MULTISPECIES: homoserine kinase [Bacillus]|uniref:Homoserine kinase n=1 Tax=Bacillus cereus TaxID=1396 RepID=A0A9X7G5L5_BACCE|nr:MULTISPECIES: homoserine kinase [Bacillus]AKR34856.1 Homoserine kinase [Bacillus thuringiensis serovar indiana]ANE85220.1 homoserine kinase [Bacillus cereus]ARZ62125.1 homoserine kinase [Bacillus thuringiensis]EJQ06484.1 homoserine kinase [Bacillus cereus BAG3O-2]EJQ29985.1 homoserine kinase [Bacillus cereus BAG4O-1]